MAQWALHCVARASLSSCGTGSVVATHKLSCPAACGILVPQPGKEPVSPELQGRFLTTGPPGKSHDLHLYCLSSSLEYELHEGRDLVWLVQLCIPALRTMTHRVIE